MSSELMDRLRKIARKQVTLTCSDGEVFTARSIQTDHDSRHLICEVVTSNRLECCPMGGNSVYLVRLDDIVEFSEATS